MCTEQIYSAKIILEFFPKKKEKCEYSPISAPQTLNDAIFFVLLFYCLSAASEIPNFWIDASFTALSNNPGEIYIVRSFDVIYTNMSLYIETISQIHIHKTIYTTLI